MGGAGTLRGLRLALVALLGAACLESPPDIGEPSCDVATDIAEIALGRDHACALLGNGGVWCWGLNDQGQIGDGTAIDRSLPSQVVGLSNVVRIAVGQDHSCAVRKDATLWCWGSASNGQLGNGSTEDSFEPVEAELEEVIDVSLGDDFSCAITADRAVHCWGENGHGQIGPGFGEEVQAESPVAIELDGAQAVVTGKNHACALLEGGEVACWGAADLGQLGDGTLAERGEPQIIGDLAGVTHLASGSNHTCAIAGDGELWCWGSNERGQLGLPGNNDVCTSSTGVPTSCRPIRVTLAEPVVDVAGGLHHTCAALEDGAVWCFGGNGAGQLGNGRYDDSTDPVKVSIGSSIASVAAGETQSCAASADHSVYCWGSNRAAQLADTGALIVTTPLAVGGTTGATAIAAGAFHSCAVIADKLSCWGANDSGQLGDGSLQARSTPTRAVTIVGAPPAVSPGEQHTCIINGTANVRCWGRSEHGEVGPNGEGEYQLTAVAVPLAADILQVDSGDEHVCAVGDDQKASCWGSDENGKLGNGTAMGAGPDPVALSGVVEVASGDEHSCARLASGEINCWGDNSLGQLGDDSTTDRDAPAAGALALDSVEVEVGDDFSCSIDSAGAVSCWGGNLYGQLGAGTPVERSLTPVEVALPSAASALVLGGLHACAIVQDGGGQAVMCWGRNDGGQLGDGTTDSSAVPRPVALEGEPLAIAAGTRHTCALVAMGGAGEVHCWGSDIDGTLGSGRDLYRVTAYGPITVCP